MHLIMTFNCTLNLIITIHCTLNCVITVHYSYVPYHCCPPSGCTVSLPFTVVLCLNHYCLLHLIITVYCTLSLLSTVHCTLSLLSVCILSLLSTVWVYLTTVHCKPYRIIPDQCSSVPYHCCPPSGRTSQGTSVAALKGHLPLPRPLRQGLLHPLLKRIILMDHSVL